MITFLEGLSAIQNDKIQNTINYFWRIFDAKIYDQATQKLKCPEIQGLFSSIYAIYEVFFNLCNLSSWNTAITEDTLRQFRNLVLLRNWDSELVKDELYGEPNEKFVFFFTKFVNEIREIPMTNIADKINQFKKNCEIENKSKFQVQREKTGANRYQLYTDVKQFWGKANRANISYQAIQIPETTEMNSQVDGNLILIKWRLLLRSTTTYEDLSKHIRREMNLMEMPLGRT